MDLDRLPSRRTTAELTAKAAELRQMAATATTQEARDALLRLADRYDRVAAQARESVKAPSNQLPSTVL